MFEGVKVEQSYKNVTGLAKLVGLKPTNSECCRLAVIDFKISAKQGTLRMFYFF